MPKGNFIYIEHILSCIMKIRSYTKDVTEEQFSKNDIVQDAMNRNFEIIGEATTQLSTEFRTEHPDISWKEIAGMRDILIHDCIGVDILAVWDTVQKYLPERQNNLENILKD